MSKPNMEPTNDDRADWAHIALEAFAAVTTQDTSGDLEHAKDSVLGDLLADLMHWCEREYVDFNECLATSASHFSSEVEE